MKIGIISACSIGFQLIFGLCLSHARRQLRLGDTNASLLFLFGGILGIVGSLCLGVMVISSLLDPGIY